MEQIQIFLQEEWQLASLFIALLVALIILTWRERAMGAFRVDAISATRLINKEQAVVVDLRDNNAFAQGHIVGSKNIPQSQLLKSSQELAKNKEKPIILVCDLGRMSVSCGAQLRKQGFSKVYVLTGGIQAWRSAGLPLAR